MPLSKRRKSGTGECNGKEKQESRMTAEPSNAVTIEKCDNGTPASYNINSLPSSSSGNLLEREKRQKQTQRQDSTQNEENNINNTGTVNTRSRVIKRPRRDLIPATVPVKKRCPASKDSKASGTPKTKLKAKSKRQWELWSPDDNEAFFEGLCEFGKDFDAVTNLIAQRSKRKNAPGPLKNKDQVRFFYYRTWNKISKHLNMIQATDVKKENQELYGLINFGVLRKKVGAVLDEKNAQKLNELVYTGTTTVKVKGKNIRLRTPVCTALKKINNIEVSEEKAEPGVKVPENIQIELFPCTNQAWSTVQSLSQNPRLRMLLKPNRKFSTVITYLTRKWMSQRMKLKESLSGPNEADLELTLFTPKDCDIRPVTLQEAPKEPRLDLAFNTYRESLFSSPSVIKVKKSSSEDANKPTSDNSSQDIDTGISESPKLFKLHKDKNKTNKNSSSYAGCSLKTDVNVIVEGENAMFPDNCSSPSLKQDTAFHSSEPSVKDDQMSDSLNQDGAINKDTENSDERAADQDDLSEVANQMIEKTKKGWNSERAENVTIIELYLMFGNDGKLKFEYDWMEKPLETFADRSTAQLTNMLRRLLHLAATEFTDFSKTACSLLSSPCRTCGGAGTKPQTSGRGSRGQLAGRPHGRSPLSLKSSVERAGLVDMGTQTIASALKEKSLEKSSRLSQDAVFRVPVASPAALQHKPFVTTHNVQLDSFTKPNNRGKKIRSVPRRNYMMQRTLLPKTTVMPRQTFTFVPMLRNTHPGMRVGMVQQPQTIIGQPVGIQLTMPGTVEQQNVQNPITTLAGTTVALTTTVQSDTAVNSNQILTMPSTVMMSESLSPSDIVSSQFISSSANPLTQSHFVSTAHDTGILNSEDPILSGQTSQLSSTHHNPVSPPSMSSLLDISLSGITCTDNSDKIIDMAMGTSGFSGLIDGTKSGNDPCLSTPPLHGTSKNITPPNSPSSHWLNGETPDISLTSFLVESPLKRADMSGDNGIMHLYKFSSQSAFFGENSRDILNVDSTLVSMMNENSLDYVSKFEELIQTVQADVALKKNDSNS